MSEVDEKAKRIKLLCMDVDGVLTDGRIAIDHMGKERKAFNVRDGLAIGLWRKLGYTNAIITARSSEAVAYRAAELKIEHVVQGCRDKLAAVRGLCEELEVTHDEVAFIGDDWADLAAMKWVGLAATPADGDGENKKVAQFVAQARGGEGAVRELILTMIRAKGRYDEALGLYDVDGA